MRNSKILKGILIFLGLILIILGSWRLLDPIAFFANSGIVLSEDAGSLSEARGTGGVVVGFGFLILLGAFKQKLAYTSTITAIVLFLGFGLARLISYSLDGNPGEAVIQGLIIELVFGLLAVFALIRFREQP
jgi:hypothetical protein